MKDKKLLNRLIVASFSLVPVIEVSVQLPLDYGIMARPVRFSAIGEKIKIKNKMSDESTLMSQPPILSSLADIPSVTQCSVRTAQRLDLMLLALEALAIGGAERMLAAAKRLQLENIIKNRVVVWRLRCTNPWRRSYHRQPLTLEQAKAFVIILTDQVRQRSTLIHQLLLAEQQMLQKGLPLGHHFRLSEYLERFSSHYRARMNPRRAKVEIYLSSEEKLNALALDLLNKLLFCTGTQGKSRFWFSLFDGEIK